MRTPPASSRHRDAARRRPGASALDILVIDPGYLKSNTDCNTVDAPEIFPASSNCQLNFLVAIVAAAQAFLSWWISSRAERSGAQGLVAKELKGQASSRTTFRSFQPFGPTKLARKSCLSGVTSLLRSMPPYGEEACEASFSSCNKVAWIRSSEEAQQLFRKAYRSEELRMIRELGLLRSGQIGRESTSASTMPELQTARKKKLGWIIDGPEMLSDEGVVLEPAWVDHIKCLRAADAQHYALYAEEGERYKISIVSSVSTCLHSPAYQSLVAVQSL